MKRSDLDQWKSKEVARLLALVETERRYYQEMVAAMPISVAVVDSSLGLVAANRSFRKAYGTPGQSILKLGLRDVLDSDAVHSLVREVIASGAASSAISIEHGLSEHGSEKLRVSAQPIRDWDDDAELHALLVIEKIDAPAERAAAVTVVEPLAVEEPDPIAVVDEEKVESEAVVEPAQLEIPLAEPVVEAPAVVAEAVVDPVPAAPAIVFPCVLWTADGMSRHFTSVSDSSQSVLGIPPLHWTSTEDYFGARIHPEDRTAVLAYYETALRNEGTYSTEFRMLRPEGHPASVRETVLVHEDGTLSGVVTDFSVRRSMEEQMVQHQRNEAVHRLAGRLAHDLNNPLMIVSGYTEELAAGMPENDPRGLDMQEILSASQRIAELTSHLQTANRTQALPSSPVDLIDLLNRTVARIRAAAGEYLTAEVELPGSPMGVYAESSQLESAMLELSAALVEASSEKAHLVLSAERMPVHELVRPDQTLPPGEYIRIAVTDINAPKQDRSSNLFENILPGKEPNRDTGPSLARIYKIVREWGGTMYATHGGSVIQMFLKMVPLPPVPKKKKPELMVVPVVVPAPLPPEVVEEIAPLTEAGPSVAVEEPAHEVNAEPVPELPPAPPRKTILVVEDESGIRALMRKILQREGFVVFEAASGSEALDVLGGYQGKMDLLITDVLMPGMNGRELAVQVSVMHPEAGVLYMSGFTAETGVETGHFPPGSHFLQKPFTLGSLLRKVNEVLMARGRQHN